jgi:hypothetical protein
MPKLKEVQTAGIKTLNFKIEKIERIIPYYIIWVILIP